MTFPENIAQDEALAAMHDADPNMAHFAPAIATARSTYAADTNKIEIDEKPLIAPSAGGVWVSGWLWVPGEIGGA